MKKTICFLVIPLLLLFSSCTLQEENEALREADKILSEYYSTVEIASELDLYPWDPLKRGDHNTALEFFRKESGAKTIKVRPFVTIDSEVDISFGLYEEQLYSPSELIPGCDDDFAVFPYAHYGPKGDSTLFTFGSDISDLGKFAYEYKPRPYSFFGILREKGLFRGYYVVIGNEKFADLEIYGNKRIHNKDQLMSLPDVDIAKMRDTEGKSNFLYKMTSIKGRQYYLSMGFSREELKMHITYKKDNVGFIFALPKIEHKAQGAQRVYDAMRVRFGEGEYMDAIFDRIDSLVKYTPSSDGNVKE